MGWAVFANCFGSFAGLAQKLEVWAKEVVQEPPGAVELVDKGHPFGLLQALVAQELAHVRPVYPQTAQNSSRILLLKRRPTR